MMYKFDFANYRHVDGIENEFRKLAIKSYCYAFCTSNEVIKYGKGHDNEWKSGYWGNRAVRQADAFPGWEMGERYTTCNSKTKFRKQLIDNNLLIDKNLITLLVFDYTAQCSHLSYNETDETLLIIEGNLVNAYIEQYGTRPKCNVAKVKGEHAVNTFKDLFEFG